MIREKAISASEQFLLFLGILKMLALAFFFASFWWVPPVPAQGVADQACRGNNLLVRLANEEPEVYRSIVEAGASTLNADATLWKLEKEGQKSSWLMGTMHLADPEVSTIRPHIKNAILETDSIVIESVEVLDPQASARAMASLAHLTFLSEGTLRDLVTDDLEDELEEAVSARGIPMALAERMQPWLVATTISLPVCEFRRKQAGEKVLDNALAAFATDHGKALHGLESVAEQFNAIASLPVEYHVAALEETLRSGGLAIDMIETIKALYIEQKTGLVFPLMKHAMPASASGKGVAQFQEALIDRRNQIMLERSLPLLESGPVFVAVGALHLPGENGLVELYRQAGYQVTPYR